MRCDSWSATPSQPDILDDVLDFHRASENAALESGARFRILPPWIWAFSQLGVSQKILDLVMEPCIQKLD